MLHALNCDSNSCMVGLERVIQKNNMNLQTEFQKDSLTLCLRILCRKLRNRETFQPVLPDKWQCISHVASDSLKNDSKKPKTMWVFLNYLDRTRLSAFGGVTFDIRMSSRNWDTFNLSPSLLLTLSLLRVPRSHHWWNHVSQFKTSISFLSKRQHQILLRTFNIT